MCAIGVRVCMRTRMYVVRTCEIVRACEKVIRKFHVEKPFDQASL